MQRGTPVMSNYQRKESCEVNPLSGSLIFGHNSNSPKATTLPFRPKYNDHGFKQGQMVRHDSEKQFITPSQFKPVYYLPSHQHQHRTDEEQKSKNVPMLGRARNSDIYVPRRSNPKHLATQSAFFKPRGSGGKVNVLKETSSTTNSNEGLGAYKSEKTFPSFLRSQGRSPGRAKQGEKEGVCKQNFKFIKRLGQGKFGCVYLAQQIRTGFLVGLKVVEKERIRKDNFMTQFIRQLKIQQFLQHPNIIKIYGFFDDEHHIYIILELGSEGQLYDVIAGGTKLSEETISFVIGNLLDAVGLMHTHKILHRDIKPQNIVLVHGNIKLCDFGWAVNKKEELRSTFCGTPLYLSPEIIKGQKYDEKVDIWAVGILAYQMFYGCSPFDIQQQQDLHKIITSQINFPQGKLPSNEFRQFLTKILQKQPSTRMNCNQLAQLEFIKKYRQLQTCQQLCR